MHAFAYGARRVRGNAKAGFALLFALVVGDTTYADTGDLPASGGVLFADFTPVGDSVASATVFLSYTRGFLDGGRSEVTTSDVSLLPGDPLEVVASFAYAGATATCGGASGTSEIPDLTVGGVSVPVTGEPNQIYSIPGVLTLVINEQIGGTHDMTVNALHLTTVAGVEAVVADARSMVDCSGGGLPTFGLSASSVGTGVTPMWGVPPKDFMTGGGFFFANLWSTCVGDRVNFGFNAGPRPGTWSPDPPFGIKGHLNLIDHGPFCAVRHVEGTDVTDYYVVGDGDTQNKCRYFEGDATVDGNPGYHYKTGVCDYGEPGRNDRFQIEVSQDGATIYFADNGPRDSCPPDEPFCGDLPGGNIQLHVFG